MMPEHVHMKREDGVATVVLDRPPLNVLDLRMLEKLSTALEQLAADPESKLLLLKAEGRAFSAGVDVAEHTAERVDRMLPVFNGVVRQLLALPLPAIAAVQGAALGGAFELILACDVVLACEDARFGQPEIQLGVFPPAAAALLPRLIGRQRALDLILSGRSLLAHEAQELGLVSHVFPAAGFTAQVEAYVGRIAGHSRPVLRLAKRVVAEGLDLRLHHALDRAEAVYLTELMRFADAREGISAFMEKRRPVWTNA